MERKKAMPPEYSKMVLIQMNHAQELIRALQTHQDRILSQLLERFEPHMGDLDSEAFSFYTYKAAEILMQILKEDTERMGSADLAHTYKLLGSQQARENRQTVLERTFKKVFSLKTSILGSHGEEALSMLGISGETPRVPADLERWLERAINVAECGVILPPVTLPTMQTWSCQLIVESLKPILLELREALDNISQKQHDEKGTLTTKWQCMEQHTYTYTAMANICEAAARLVGEHDLGDRLRPRALNRPGKKKAKKRKSQKATEISETSSSGDSQEPSSTQSSTPDNGISTPKPSDSASSNHTSPAELLS